MTQIVRRKLIDADPFNSGVMGDYGWVDTVVAAGAEGLQFDEGGKEMVDSHLDALGVQAVQRKTAKGG